MIIVLMFFVLISVISVSVLKLISLNSSEILSQENKINAYYCALSGIELGTAALLEKKPNPNYNPLDDNNEPSEIDLMYEYSKKDIGSLTQDIILPDTGKSVYIEISRKIVSDKPWVEITSIGKYKNKAGKLTTSVGHVSFLAENPKINEWDLNYPVKIKPR